MNKGLTEGRPSSVLWRFTLPLLGSVLFQQMYNIADSLIAGKFCGEQALASVGNAYEVTLVYLAFGTGCNIASSVIVARLFGAKSFAKMKTAISTSVLFCMLLCGALMLTGFLFCPTLLHLINTPKEVFADSLLYLNIYTGGLIFLFIYNIITGIFSAMGDSRTPFIFLALSSSANVLVDILFVSVLDMGVSGVAWATFICQGVSAFLVVITILRRLGKIKVEEKHPIFSGHILKEFIIIAIPSTLQQLCVSIGNIFIQSIINDLGTSVIAGYAAAIKLNNLVITVFYALGNGMSNFASQNIGAKKIERVREGFKAVTKMNVILYIPIMLLYVIGAGILVSVFLKAGSGLEALEVGKRFLHLVAPFYIVVAMKIVSDGMMRGAGAMKLFMISTFSDLILRVVLAFVFAVGLGLGDIGIWLAWPIGWTIGTLVSLAFNLKGTWKKSIDKMKL